MNIGIITKPNQKGQIVIPQQYRQALDINQNIWLNLVLKKNRITIYPIKELIAPVKSEDNYYYILNPFRLIKVLEKILKNHIH